MLELQSLDARRLEFKSLDARRLEFKLWLEQGEENYSAYWCFTFIAIYFRFPQNTQARRGTSNPPGAAERAPCGTLLKGQHANE
jgi:hypothetical protein